MVYLLSVYCKPLYRRACFTWQVFIVQFYLLREKIDKFWLTRSLFQKLFTPAFQQGKMLMCTAVKENVTRNCAVRTINASQSRGFFEVLTNCLLWDSVVYSFYGSFVDKFCCLYFIRSPTIQGNFVEHEFKRIIRTKTKKKTGTMKPRRNLRSLNWCQLRSLWSCR